MNYIDLDTPLSTLEDLLHHHNWLQPKESVQSITKAGEGNMNVVLRVRTNLRSFILKQSRPYVQKYPQIEAPLDRIDVEYQFYQAIQTENIQRHIPAVMAYNPQQYLLLLEDLGDVEDMTSIYQKKDISDEDVSVLVRLLSDIHKRTPPVNYPENMTLRKLNHQHIFVLPFKEDNGFDLHSIQKGLQRIAIPYKEDSLLKTAVERLGEHYLSTGTILLHGDYYPGSWMKSKDRIYVLDPEFSFVGFAEFDLGVMAAHFIIATLDPAYVDTVAQHYDAKIDLDLMRQVAGVEIIRRIIGLAQLPLPHSLEEKAYLLELARQLILP